MRLSTTLTAQYLFFRPKGIYTDTPGAALSRERRATFTWNLAQFSATCAHDFKFGQVYLGGSFFYENVDQEYTVHTHATPVGSAEGLFFKSTRAALQTGFLYRLPNRHRLGFEVQATDRHNYSFLLVITQTGKP